MQVGVSVLTRLPARECANAAREILRGTCDQPRVLAVNYNICEYIDESLQVEIYILSRVLNLCILL
jgi:hypothetical protein